MIFGFYGIHFPGPTEVRQARLETQAFGRSLLPLETSKRRAARGPAALVLQFALGFGAIHVLKPIAGRGSGPSVSGGPSTANARCPKLLQRHLAALLTRPARTGLRST